jgi:hypothetical protein
MLYNIYIQMADIANILKGVSDEQLLDLAEGSGSILALETAAILGLSAYNMNKVLQAVEREQLRRKAEKRLAQIVLEEGEVPVFQSGNIRDVSSAAAGALAAAREAREESPLLGSSRRDTGLRQRRGAPRFSFSDPAIEQERIRTGISSGLRDVPLDEPEPVKVEQPRPRQLPRPRRRTVGLVGGAGAITAGLIASIIGVDASDVKINPDGTADIIDKRGNRRRIDTRTLMSGTTPSATANVGVPRLKHKYKTPRKGRYNYVDFVTHAYAAAARTGAVNNIVDRNITNKINQLDLGSKMRLIKPVDNKSNI